MHCPSCQYEDLRVYKTRQNADGDTERRRECLKCGLRITTSEKVKQHKPKAHRYVIVT